MAAYEDGLKLQIPAQPVTTGQPASERVSLGKFELKYGGGLGSNTPREDLQRDLRKLPQLELKYDSPYAPKINIGPEKIDLSVKPNTSTTATSTKPQASEPTVEQQRQALEQTRKQLSPKTWEEFTRTWGPKGIEEYKKALSDYATKVTEFSKKAGDSAAAGLELKITAGEMGFKTRLLASAKRDGIEAAVVARKLLATGLQTAAISTLMQPLAAAERQNVVRSIGSIVTDLKEQKELYAAIGTERSKVPASVATTTPKKKKPHFGEPEITITVKPANKDKLANK